MFLKLIDSSNLIYLSDEQARKIKEVLIGGREKFIAVNGEIIAISGIKGLFKTTDEKVAEEIKQEKLKKLEQVRTFENLKIITGRIE